MAISAAGRAAAGGGELQPGAETAQSAVQGPLCPQCRVPTCGTNGDHCAGRRPGRHWALDTVECRVLCAEDTETRRHQCQGGYMSVVRPRAHMLAGIKLMMGE